MSVLCQGPRDRTAEGLAASTQTLHCATGLSLDVGLGCESRCLDRETVRCRWSPDKPYYLSRCFSCSWWFNDDTSFSGYKINSSCPKCSSRSKCGCKATWVLWRGFVNSVSRTFWPLTFLWLFSWRSDQRNTAVEEFASLHDLLGIWRDLLKTCTPTLLSPPSFPP